MPNPDGRPRTELDPGLADLLRVRYDLDRQATDGSRAARVALKEAVDAARQQGASISAIARLLGLSRQGLYNIIGTN